MNKDENDFQKLAIDNRVSRYLFQTTLLNKKDILNDLYNISDSVTGFLHILFLNAFIIKSEAMVINSIELFEKGYFDCSYYSLREALELANIMVYFSELSEEQRKTEVEKWEAQETLDSRKLGSFLNSISENYKEIKTKMPLFFDNIKNKKEEMNKIVHKQGYENFYCFLQTKKQNRTDHFLECINVVIGALAVLRLALDPFPILLNDEEIWRRTPNLYTDSYSDDFMDKYIGQNNVAQYKKCKSYMDIYDEIMDKERMNDAIINIVKYEHINIKEENEIVEQMHLLNNSERIVVSIAFVSGKISRIYVNGGTNWYFTETESLYDKKEFSSTEFNSYEFPTRFNIKYYNVYLSKLIINDQNYYIEHNLLLNVNEVAVLLKIEHDFNEKFDELYLEKTK